MHDSQKYTLLQAWVNNTTVSMKEHMPLFLQQVEKCCLLESSSEDTAGLNTMAEYLITLLRDADIPATTIEHPRGNAVVATLTGSNATAPTLLLLGHHDTVHPMGVASARTYRDGNRFYGPGTIDMKAGLLQGIFALSLLCQQGYQDFHKVIFVSVPDEEISERYHLDLLKQLAQERPLVIGLEGAKSVGTVVTRRKGSALYRLTAEGRAAHAGSSPDRGRNAVLELAHQIVQASHLATHRPGITINAGPMRGGSRPNIVSDFAEILFNLRFLHADDQHAIEALWHERLRDQLVSGVNLTLEIDPHVMPPMVATEQSLAMASQMEFICKHILQVPFAPETRGGASDCCVMAAEGCSAIDGLGAVGTGAHTQHEYIAIPPVPDRVALLVGLIIALTTTHIQQSNSED